MITNSHIYCEMYWQVTWIHGWHVRTRGGVGSTWMSVPSCSWPPPLSFDTSDGGLRVLSPQGVLKSTVNNSVIMCQRGNKNQYMYHIGVPTPKEMLNQQQPWCVQCALACFITFSKKKLSKKNLVNHPRIELGPNAWKASILTIILAIRIIVVKSWKFFAIPETNRASNSGYHRPVVCCCLKRFHRWGWWFIGLTQ